MPISTEDCRKFIVEFQSRNPQIEQTRFGGELDAEAQAALTVPKNWKRQTKVRPDSATDSHDPVKTYMTYGEGLPVNRFAEGQVKVDAKTIAWERRFDCQPFEGQVAYLILETHDGDLIFGDYVSD